MATKVTKKSTKKQVKKTAVTDTSRKAFAEINRDGLPQIEKQLVLKAIQEMQPCTSRMLMYRVKKERGNITRTLYNLVRSETVKIAFAAKCKTTNKTVSYYTTMDWKEASNG